MNTHERDFSAAAAIDRHDVRRKAEILRAEQTVRIFRGLARTLSAGYSKLASYGASIGATYHTPKALY